MTDQDVVFLKSEGGQWFKRNHGSFHMSEIRDRPLFLIEQYGLRPKKVLEIGCSNGWRLGAIQQMYHANCVGVEPSVRAIADGKKKYPQVTFKRGLASSLPLKTTFDLVIVNYVLHWVSREHLYQTIAEIDRVVADGGFLIIGDFFPDVPTMKPYHHLPKGKAYTYKLDYANFFISSTLYQLIAKVTYDYSTRKLLRAVSGDDRSVCNLLRKSFTDYYVTMPSRRKKI